SAREASHDSSPSLSFSQRLLADPGITTSTGVSTMRPLVLTILTLGFVVSLPAPAAEKDAAKADAKKMQGTWQAVKAEIGGAPLPDDSARNLKVVIKDNMITIDGVPDSIQPHSHSASVLGPPTIPNSIDFKV